MHVVHLYKDFDPPVVGGIERMIRWTAVRTARRPGCRVTVVVARPAGVAAPAALPTDETIDGVRVLRLRALGRPGGNPLCPTMARTVAAVDPTIVHAHHPCPMADLALWQLAADHRPPFVVTWHSDVVRQRVAYVAYRPLQRWLLRHAAAIMPTSERYRASSAQLTVPQEACTVVPLGVDFAETAPAPDPARLADWRARLAADDAPIVLFVGVLRYYKGLDHLLAAWPRLEERAHLVLVGDGPLRAQLEADAARLRADHDARITLAGRLDDADVAALRALASLAVMPSHLRSEAFGLGQIEAMAAGLPVVACDLDTGVPEVNRHEVSGLIVRPADPDALAAAISRLLRCDDLRTALGERARERALTYFHADRMEEAIFAVYRRVLEERGGRRS